MMNHVNTLMQLIHEFEKKTTAMVPPTHVVMHPKTHHELLQLRIGPPRVSIDDGGFTVTIFKVMNAKMTVYRSYDVEPGKFIVG